jgi:hypothetical protein
VKRQWDPHMDPLRAPSALGHHPHAFQSGAENGEHLEVYEYRNDMLAARPPPPVHQAAAPPDNSILNLTLLGLGVVGAVALYSMVREREDDRRYYRRNPDPAPPAPSPVVVYAPGPATTCPPPAALPAGLPTVTDTVVEKKKEKPKGRKRRTTQGRNALGWYIEAGKGPARTEGKGRKKRKKK